MVRVGKCFVTSGSATVELAVPFHESFDAFLNADFRAVAEIPFQRGRVRPGCHDVAFLHFLHVQDGLLPRDLFDGADEVEQLDRTAVADIVKTVFRRFRDDAFDAFHDVVHIGEVAGKVSEVVDVNGLALQDGLGELEHGHINTSPRAISSLLFLVAAYREIGSLTGSSMENGTRFVLPYTLELEA